MKAYVLLSLVPGLEEKALSQIRIINGVIEVNPVFPPDCPPDTGHPGRSGDRNPRRRADLDNVFQRPCAQKAH